MSGSDEEDSTASVTPVPSKEATPIPSARRAKYSRMQNPAFPAEQESFLLIQFPLYLEHARKNQGEGVRGIKNVKGAKKTYITSTLFPAFKEEFPEYCSGKDKKEMVQKIARFMSNRLGTARRQENRAAGVPNTNQLSKKPRHINAFRLFEAQNKDKLTKVVGKSVKENNTNRNSRLSEANKIKLRLFNELSPDAREKLNQEAAEQNRMLSMKPSQEQIYENQKYLGDKAAEVLHGLRGDNWGQFGEFVYFTIGAYRNSINDLKLFYFSGGHERVQTSAASNFLEDPAVGALRASFTRFANDVIPVSGAATGKGKGRANPAVPRACIILDPQREPLLPDIDYEQLTIEEARQLLEEYIHFSWVHELYGRNGCPEGEEEIPPPWEALDSLGVDEGHYLADVDFFPGLSNSNSSDCMQLYSSLNPQLCSDEDVVQLLQDIFRCHHDYDIRIIVFKMDDDQRAQVRYDADPGWFTPRVQSPVHITRSSGTTMADTLPPTHLNTPSARITRAGGGTGYRKRAVPSPTPGTPVEAAAPEIGYPKNTPPTASPPVTPPATSHTRSPEPVKAKAKRAHKLTNGKPKSTTSQTAKTAIVGSSKVPRQRKPPPPPREGSRRIHNEKYTNTAVNVRAARQA